MKSKSIILFILLTFSAFSFNLQAQTIGKIFSKSEANTLFGIVLESKTMSVSELNSIISQTNNYVMFLIRNGAIAIKGDGGNVIYNSGLTLNVEDVFAKYSKSIVEDLLNMTISGEIFIEKRNNTITISNITNTLEFAVNCPPFCP